MNDNLERTDVVIVGAGPTGLTAAIRLAQLGVPYVLLDRAAAPTSTSNAALMHAASLELFAELGVSDELVAAGRKMTSITMVDRGKPLIRLKLTNLPTRHAFALGIPQSTTERILLGRLSALGGSVRRLHRVTSVDTDADGPVVTGTIESADGPTPFVIHARYLIGADGSHSVVRAAIGLDFRGETYPAQFVLADVALDNPAGADSQATINMSARGVTVLGLLPSGNHRIIATVDAAVDAPQTPDRAFVDSLLRERAIPARSIAEPVWSSRFRVHHRVASQFRVGDIFLAGDAAHIHSPAAGQGMNTGIADAFDLSTRLAAVLTGQAGAHALDAYEQQRRAVALEVLRFTDRMTRMAMLSNPVARLVRRAVAGTVGRLGPVQRRLAMWVTGLERSPLRSNLPTTVPRPATPRR